jgi:ribosome-binding protein aMBF1 (putative translation factor)
MTITGGQVREARALLGWSTSKLSVRAALGAEIIRQFELGERLTSPTALAALRAAHEAEGVEFLTERAGVRLRKRT